MSSHSQSFRQIFSLKTGLLAVKHLFLLSMAFIMLLPLIWMFSAALKRPVQFFKEPLNLIPNPVMWSNFVEASESAPFSLFLYNSMKVAVLVTIGTLIFSSLAAYAFARLEFPGKGIAFSVLLGTMMIPYTVRVIPLFIMFKYIGWIDQHIALIVPPALSNVFGVFLLRQFFMTIPRELDDAARIDGCSSFGVYARILLPLTKPALATLFLFTFRNSWNQFLPALIFINSAAKQLITVGLTMFQGEFETAWHLMMAGAVMAVLPMLIIYLVAQRYFIRGVMMSGLKG